MRAAKFAPKTITTINYLSSISERMVLVFIAPQVVMTTIEP